MTRRALSYRLRRAVLAPLLILALFAAGLTASSRQAQAFGFICCVPCFAFECIFGAIILIGMHSLGENLLENWIENEFDEHREWLIEVFFREELGYAMARFTEQMSAVAMQQAMMAGAFLDAKHQLETQRLFQQLRAQAHKDYQPSEDFCWFGTNVRSMASSEMHGDFNALALSQRAMARHLGNAGLSGSASSDEDLAGRWRRFTTDYCDPRDNNWQGPNSGLELACGTATAPQRNRVNRDIDYARLIDEPRTISADFTSFNPGLSADGEEEDVLALANNLYGHNVLSRTLSSVTLRNKQAQERYLWLRSIAAKRSVAENSFNAIVGLKSSGTPDAGPAPPRTREYMASILDELGVGDENGNGTNADEIYGIIGTNPSYYAQLEILGKKIYQNPNFYANLYDKPANVERKAVALRAVDLMLGRAMFESQLRREMLLSVLLESRLRSPSRDVNQEIMGLINN